MSGKTDILKGRIKEAAGVLVNNDKLREAGKSDQAVGQEKQTVDKAVEVAKDAAQQAMESAQQVARQAVDSSKSAMKSLRE